MGRLVSPVGFWAFGCLLLVAPQSVVSWYKHTASPRYHTVGRASGLLIGVRHSPYLWRRDALSSQQETGDEVGASYGQQMYPNLRKTGLLLGNPYKHLKEERSPNEEKVSLQNEQNLGGNFNNPSEEDRPYEDQNLESNQLLSETDLRSVRKSLEGNHLIVNDPEEKRMLEVTWPIIHTGAEAQSLDGEQLMLEQSMNEARILNRETRGHHDPGQGTEPDREDILQEEKRPYPQPWRRHLPTHKQQFDFNSKTSESVNCEDQTWMSNKLLCSLQSLLNSQSTKPRRQSPVAVDPELVL